MSAPNLDCGRASSVRARRRRRGGSGDRYAGGDEHHRAGQGDVSRFQRLVQFNAVVLEYGAELAVALADLLDVLRLDGQFGQAKRRLEFDREDQREPGQLADHDVNGGMDLDAERVLAEEHGRDLV